MKQLEADKAKVDDELAELKNKLEEIESENVNLHQVTLETNSVVEEKLQLASSVAQLQADNECLLKENEYYKTDLIPTMQEKSKEMQRKFREHEAQRKALLKENESMKNSENELLQSLRKASEQSSNENEALKTQVSSLKARFDEQLVQRESFEQTIANQKDQLHAFESKLKLVTEEKAEADGVVERLQGDLEDL